MNNLNTEFPFPNVAYEIKITNLTVKPKTKININSVRRQFIVAKIFIMK